MYRIFQMSVPFVPATAGDWRDVGRFNSRRDVLDAVDALREGQLDPLEFALWACHEWRKMIMHPNTTVPNTRTVSADEFYRLLREEGSMRNTASTTTYDERNDETTWLLAGHPVGITCGKVGATRSYHWIIGEIDVDSRTITEWNTP